jgi:ParB-like chromosome segregation protein Spo0J
VIVEGLENLAVPIERLRPMDRNPRKGDVQAVERSLARFGQRKPVVATLDGTIIAGNHTHAAAVRLGWSEIAVVYVEDDDTEAKAFALADNRTSDLGAYDNALLADLMREVAANDLELLESASYSAQDLDDLIDFMNGPANRGADDGEIDPERGNGVSGLSCPNCGFAL